MARPNKNVLLRQFGAIVREYRLGIGISQEELGLRTELDRTYIGGIERGERNISLLNIARLAMALGLSLSELFIGVALPEREAE